MRHLRAAIFLLALTIGAAGQFLSAQTHSGEDSLHDRLVGLLPGLTAGEVELLESSGELTIPYGLEPGSDVSTRLAPAFGRAIHADLDALDPRIGVEVLFLVDAPAKARSVTPELFTTLQSISTMEGIEYYSASRDRMRTLFHESYVIKGAEDRTRLGDPRVNQVPARDVLHVFQRDSSFGSNVLELTYAATPRAVRLRMRNLTQMYYMGFIPAVGPQELGLNLVVYPLGEKLLFYGNSAANPISLLGLEARVQRSFYNRLVALYDWFMSRA
ncbi:MAG: DUF6675 family protein [Spirochaetota bacterium]